MNDQGEFMNIIDAKRNDPAKNLSKFLIITLNNLNNKLDKNETFNNRIVVYVKILMVLVESIFVGGYNNENFGINISDLDLAYFVCDQKIEKLILSYSVKEDVLIMYFKTLVNLLKEEKICNLFFENLAKALFLNFIVRQVEKANLTKKGNKVIQQEELIFFVLECQFYFINEKVLEYFLAYLENFSPKFCQGEIVKEISDLCRFESNLNFIDFMNCMAIELEDNLEKNFLPFLEEYDPDEEYERNKGNENGIQHFMFPKES